MQSENTLQEETAEVYKAVKMLCAQYQVPQDEMRAWMDAVNAFDQYGHGMISTEQVGLAIRQICFRRVLLNGCASCVGRWRTRNAGVPPR